MKKEFLALQWGVSFQRKTLSMISRTCTLLAAAWLLAGCGLQRTPEQQAQALAEYQAKVKAENDARKHEASLHADKAARDSCFDSVRAGLERNGARDIRFGPKAGELLTNFGNGQYDVGSYADSTLGRDRFVCYLATDDGKMFRLREKPYDKIERRVR